MAKNTRLKEGWNIDLTVPPGTASGDPVKVGAIVGYANTDRDAISGKASVCTQGSALFTVKAANAGGNSAIAEGDLIYFDAALTPKLSKIPTAPAVVFGVALTTLALGATGEVEVLIKKSV